ncbi:MAG: L,D-transpeptidase [Chloroflexi bacterium]|nr:L,D-transpeptidase [Chloroflexota bacterium]
MKRLASAIFGGLILLAGTAPAAFADSGSGGLAAALGSGAAKLATVTIPAPAVVAAPAAPAPPPAPPSAPPAPAAPAPLVSQIAPPGLPGKVIVVSLSLEKLFAFQDNNLLLQTLVTTGGPRTGTPIGVFHVVAKRSNFIMQSPWPEDDWRWYPDSYVNYGLLFDWSGYFIHDAPWRSNFGPGSNSVFGTAGGAYTGTHGCVNVPLEAETNLYNWAPIGTTVIIQS